MKKHFPVFIFCLALVACSSSTEEKTTETKKEKVPLYGLESAMDKTKAPFYHGVASGDPLQHNVIIWTRVTPEYHQRVQVKWEVGLEPYMSTVVQSGEIFVDSVTDYTVKVDVRGLQPGQYYYYRFEALGKKSETGRTKTLPQDGVEHVRLAFASCSNFAWGYFHAYDLMAQDTLDVVIHLGDYIYEHEPEVYSAKKEDRQHVPAKELITLSDYRTRYAQYRLDKNLQKVHASHPFITVWDDHELANNAYDEGAQNHQENEGDWKQRLAIAEKVYYEWMPVRNGSHQLYRSFAMGNLANLIMLDTRVEGRDKQEGIGNEAWKNDTTRKIIGKEQFTWLEKELAKPFQWKIIGNQVLFGSMKIFFSSKGELYNDGWDDYPYQKDKLAGYISRLKNVLFVTGDFHSSFALKNMMGQKEVAREFVVPSISSANYDEDLGPDSARIYTDWYRKGNQNLMYVNLVDHGYMVLDINGNQAKGIFKYVSSVTDKAYTPMKEVVIKY